MYEYLRGTLVKKQPTRVVVEVQGVGYVLKTSLSTSEQLPEEGATVELKTYLHVREDLFQLYGFATEEEREIFLGLIAVSGVGPKLALTILSGLSPQKFVTAISQGDERLLNSVSGVGKKTAQRLLVELKDKLAGFTVQANAEQGEQLVRLTDMETEAMMALISLGYKKNQAERALLKARKSEHVLTVEDLIKKSLQSI